jgi:hypothetical protein
MARLWATVLKELNTARTAEEFRGPGIKGPTGKGYANTGTINTDFLVPDIEQDALTLTDTNNTYPIVSYASNGGVRHLPVVGYSVGGAYMTKLYREQCRFLFDAALRKRSESNPLGDLPSFQIDLCHWDSDPIAPRLISDSYKGVKFGAFGLTVGAASPLVTCMFQLTGSICNTIPQTVPGVPNYGQEPSCDGYPNDIFTFKDTKIYADFDGDPLWTTTDGVKSWTPPADSKKILTVRSLSLNFVNTLATSSHNEGIVDRIQRTVQALQYSMVVDLVDPDATGTEDTLGSTAYGSQVWREKYRLLRESVESGRLSLGVTFERPLDTRISIDLGSRSVLDGYQSIKPIPDIFAAQISGFAMFDPSSCSTYDWDIADIS